MRLTVPIVVLSIMLLWPILRIGFVYLWRRGLLMANRYLLLDGLRDLMRAYDGVEVSPEEMRMLNVAESLHRGRIPVYRTLGSVQGAFLSFETDEQLIFLIPRDRLLHEEFGSPEFIPAYLAGEMADFVSLSEDDVDELSALIMRHEWVIRAFIRLRELGHQFGPDDSGLMVDKLEEAAIYAVDRNAWLIRIRAKLFHEIPDLIPDSV